MDPQPGRGPAGYYSVAEAARRLGLSEAAIRKRIARGAMSAVRGPGQTRIPVDEVEGLRQRELALIGIGETSLDQGDGLARQLTLLREVTVREIPQLFADQDAEIQRLREELEASRGEVTRLQAALRAINVANKELSEAVSQLTMPTRLND